MDNTKLERQMKRFETYLMIDRGLAQVTAEGYCRETSIALRRMKKFVPQYEHVKDYMAWMRDKEYSYSYIVNSMTALEHYAQSKGIKGVKFMRPKKPKRIIQDVLSEAEVSRIIQMAPGIRTKALVCLLAYSGVRASELCKIKLTDLNLGNNHVVIRDGKNRTDGVVNISAECTNILMEYLRAYPREINDYLFSVYYDQNTKLPPSAVRKHIKILSRRAKIGRRVYPHLFRHSLATNLLNRGASLMMIQQQLRHRHIESTMIYVLSRPARNRSEYDHYTLAYL